MAFIFTCGTHTFRNRIEGFENVPVQCHRCMNWSGQICKEWQWFTFCFIPVIPLGGSWKQVFCPICSNAENVKYRPDVQQMLDGGGGQQIPMQGGPTGWNNQPGQPGPPPQTYDNKPAQMHYNQPPDGHGQQPMYK